MFCYNCGCALSEHDFCTACGADVSLYKKIMSVSNLYYNEGLEKAGVKANEAIVVENAPIGVQAGAAAGIFTIAVNTGPLDGQVLLDAGANLLFPSMQAFCDNWEAVRDALASEK